MRRIIGLVTFIFILYQSAFAQIDNNLRNIENYLKNIDDDLRNIELEQRKQRFNQEFKQINNQRLADIEKQKQKIINDILGAPIEQQVAGARNRYLDSLKNYSINLFIYGLKGTDEDEIKKLSKICDTCNAEKNKWRNYFQSMRKAVFDIFRINMEEYQSTQALIDSIHDPSLRIAFIKILPTIMQQSEKDVIDVIKDMLDSEVNSKK
jgi:hypothetical protein